jgi:Raf kinase inhibitor-like YbhB/YbcL family protein
MTIMANDPNWRLPPVPTFLLESSDFAEGDPLPEWVRADGGNRAPSLRWSGAPDTTKSYVLTVYDPDAPTGSGFWHWAVRDIPASTTELPAGGSLPAQAVTMANELRGEEFTGAAPPPGDGVHRYFFTVSALDVESLNIPAGATPAVLGFMLRGHIVGRAQLMGTAETPAS